MKPRTPLAPDERNILLDHRWRAPHPDLRLRAPIILLLGEAYPWATIAAALFGSTRTITHWKHRFEPGRAEAAHQNQQAATAESRSARSRVGGRFPDQSRGRHPGSCLAVHLS